MPLPAQDIYRSPNGDRWRLMHDPATGRRFVRHEANAASGGQVTDTELDDFLSIDGPGPEYAGLRELLRSKGEVSQGDSAVGTGDDKLRNELEKQPVAPTKDSAGFVRKVGGSTPTPAVADDNSPGSERTEKDEKMQHTGLPGG